MNTKLLRQKVLDLAIHGKLVTQNPEHEPASKLLERIRGESLPLATAGKPSSASPSPRGKAPKTPSAPISEDEIPFEIPENWCWCRLPDISKNIIAGGDKPDIFSKEKNGECFVPIYSNGIENNGLYGYTNEARILEPSITVSARGTIGFSCIRMEPFLPIVRLISITPECLIEIKYIKYVLDTLLIQGEGSSIPQLTVPSIKQFLFPLPPLEEQKLIVEEIERIFALIDTVEQNKTDLETVIKQTKSKILDLAIHGKLVPQDKTDEPASKMLEKLRAEKEEKIAKGQLKRDKNDSYIYKLNDGKWKERKADGSEEEIEVPFEIPESWSWCRLNSLVSELGDGIHGTPNYTENGDYYFINGNNLNNGNIEIKKETRTVNENEFLKYKKELNDSTIFVSINGTLGNVAFYNNEHIILGKSTCYFNVLNKELKAYLYNIISSNFFKDYAEKVANGSTIKNVSLQSMRNFIIPLPPLEEQKRIISQIEVINSKLNEI